MPGYQLRRLDHGGQAAGRRPVIPALPEAPCPARTMIAPQFPQRFFQRAQARAVFKLPCLIASSCSAGSYPDAATPARPDGHTPKFEAAFRTSQSRPARMLNVNVNLPPLPIQLDPLYCTRFAQSKQARYSSLLSIAHLLCKTCVIDYGIFNTKV